MAYKLCSYTVSVAGRLKEFIALIAINLQSIVMQGIPKGAGKKPGSQKENKEGVGCSNTMQQDRSDNHCIITCISVFWVRNGCGIWVSMASLTRSKDYHGLHLTAPQQVFSRSQVTAYICTEPRKSR